MVMQHFYQLEGRGQCEDVLIDVRTSKRSVTLQATECILCRIVKYQLRWFIVARIDDVFIRGHVSSKLLEGEVMASVRELWQVVNMAVRSCRQVIKRW